MGPSSPHKKRRRSPQFSAHVCCCQTAGWIKIPHCMEVGLSPGHVVRWEPSSPLKRAQPPIFSRCLLRSNGWMDHVATWYIRRPWPRPHCVRLGPISPIGAQPCIFWPISVVTKYLDGSRCQLVRRRLLPMPHCVRPGSKKEAQHPHFLAHVYCGQTAGLIKM